VFKRCILRKRKLHILLVFSRWKNQVLKDVCFMACVFIFYHWVLRLFLESSKILYKSEQKTPINSNS